MNSVSSGVNPQFTAIAAVIAAVISLIGVVLTIVFNVHISKRNNEIQRELAQKNIDANLKAKARIEWITEVRQRAANLISGLVRLKDASDLEHDTMWTKIVEETELLKLYFGSFGMSEIKKYDRNILFLEDSNKKKNIHIFLFIDDMLKSYSKKGKSSYRFTLSRKKNIENRLHAISDEMSKISEYTSTGLDEDEEVMIEQVPFKGHEGEYSNLNQKYFSILSSLDSINTKIEKYDRLTNDFEKIISIYLKIEWEAAKRGE